MRYRVIVSRRAEQMLVCHTEFLTRVSIRAAKRLRDEFSGLLDELEREPRSFPPVLEPKLPGEYCKALFEKRYQAVFCIEGDRVYLDAVLDCRMDNTAYFGPDN